MPATPRPLTRSPSDDSLLGGRVRLRQPGGGYRVAMDSVLLAAAVPARPADRVLDIGAGVGAASLCLAARVPECRVDGIELDAGLAALAGANAAANGWGRRVEILAGDILDPPAALTSGGYDVVMTNPPYMARGRGNPPPDPARAAALVEGAADLAAWLDFAVAMARPRGFIVLIHRADRVDEILRTLGARVGGVVLLPLWPRATARTATRVIVAARKGAAAPARILRGLVLHEADGAYTPAVEAILRGEEALDFDLG